MDIFKLSNLKKLLIFNLPILITMIFLNNGQTAERTWVTGYYPLPVGPGFVTETCNDECNNRRCVDDSTYEKCIRSTSSPCYFFAQQTQCSEGTVCKDGICIDPKKKTWVKGYYPLPVGPGFVTETCYDECELGVARCDPNDRTRGERCDQWVDDDPCYEWLSISCASIAPSRPFCKQTSAFRAECVYCEDECELGVSKCDPNDRTRAAKCDQWVDDDPCYEWLSISCASIAPSRPFCRQTSALRAQCVYCEDECDHDRCIDDYTLERCSRTGSWPCNTYTSPTTCPTGTVCRDGSCTGLPDIAFVSSMVTTQDHIIATGIEELDPIIIKFYYCNNSDFETGHFIIRMTRQYGNNEDDEDVEIFNMLPWQCAEVTWELITAPVGGSMGHEYFYAYFDWNDEVMEITKGNNVGYIGIIVLPTDL
jgi:hypothetical protein